MASSLRLSVISGGVVAPSEARLRGGGGMRQHWPDPEWWLYGLALLAALFAGVAVLRLLLE